MPGAVSGDHHEEGNQADEFEDGTDRVRGTDLFEKTDAESNANDDGALSGREADAAAIRGLVMLEKPLHSFVL